MEGLLGIVLELEYDLRLSEQKTSIRRNTILYGICIPHYFIV